MIVNTIADLSFIPTHCDACSWQGTAAQGRVTPGEFVRCPRCAMIIRCDLTRTQRTTDRVLYTPTKARKA